MSEQVIITWDIGATKCAAATVIYDEISQALTCQKSFRVKLRECDSFAHLTDTIEQGLDIKMSAADVICIGAAGQYDGDVLQLDKGYPYVMNIAEVAKQNNWPEFAVVHDYTPIVCATFTPYINDPNNIKLLNPGSFDPHGRRVALGIGTGLGVKDGVLLPDGNFWIGTNEMGHIGITQPPLAHKYYLRRHKELIKFMRSEGFVQKDTPLSFERILSGSGIAALHQFISCEAVPRAPEEVSEQCHSGQADETLAMVAWYMGLFIGTVQLAFMPSGGIWISGGVVLKNIHLFDHDEFYRGIGASPAYQNLRTEFPLGVLINPEHAFLGAAYYAVKRLSPVTKKIISS